MPNTAAYNGFQQYSGNGSAPTYEQVEVRIAFNSSPIYNGDPVNPDANGFIVVGVTSSGSGNTQIAGIFNGCEYLSASQKRKVWSNYYPGGTDPVSGTIAGYIINDPNAKFVAQFGNVSVDQAYVNANVGFNIGSGNANNGISGAFLATIGTDSSLPFRVVDLVTSPPGQNGTEAGAYQRAIVAFNNVSTKQLTGV